MPRPCGCSANSSRGPDAIDNLLVAFKAWLKGKGFLVMSGQIIEALIIVASRQRSTDAEKAALKEGRIPDARAARPKKLAQKDRDARWTLKRVKARSARAAGTKAKVEIAITVFGHKTKTTEAPLAKHGRRSKIHLRRQPGHDLTPAQRKANRTRSQVRSAVMTAFAGQKHRFGRLVRTIGPARARTKIGLANLAYNLQRFL